MKRVTLFLIALMSSPMALSAQTVSVRVENPMGVPRKNETISISILSLRQQSPEFKGEKLAVRSGKEQLVSQLIDENSDGAPDILIFQSSFTAHETKQFTISVSKTAQSFPQSVDALFALPREDFAWENDRVAFRVYGPALAADVNNGMDVWTKRVRYPIVKKWYHGEEQTPKVVYHIDHGEGADFFSVGRTLGAGSSGIVENGVLTQPGVFSHYRLIANGPIRVVFELYYDRWNIGGKKYLQTKRITLDAGQNLNTIEDRFISNDPPDSLTIASGLTKRANTVLSSSSSNSWLALWGVTNADTANGYLGTAIVFPPRMNVLFSEDSVQWLISAKFKSGKCFQYYAGFGWTRSGDVANETDWKIYLEAFAASIQYPLIISVTALKK